MSLVAVVVVAIVVVMVVGGVRVYIGVGGGLVGGRSRA